MDTDEKAAPAALDVDELFADFEEATDQEDAAPEPPASEPQPVERVNRKDKVLALKAENRRLREEVRLLKRISASAAGVPNSVGPLAHMCFFNRRLSVESRRKIEDFVLELSNVHRFNNNNTSGNTKDPAAQNKTSHWSTRTQPSCIRLTSDTVEFIDDESDSNSKEEPMERGGSATADTSSAGTSLSTAGLAITGSIQAHEGFLIDTVGAPLVDDLATASACFATSVYVRGFHHVLPADQEEITAKASRGGLCFNCSKSGHALHDCKMPRDEGTIQRNRQQFSMNRTPRTPVANRYHTDPSNVTDGQVSKFRPGVISDELRCALGLGESDVPLHIYRMRVLGYPPGYRLVDERKRYGADKVKCSLSLYSGEEGAADDAMDVEEPDRREARTPKIEYTPTAKETVRFPGFNAPLPAGVVDNSQQLGYPPFIGGNSTFAREDKSPSSPVLPQTSAPANSRTSTDTTTTNDNTTALAVASQAQASRRSAKFARGDEDGNADDSIDEAEDGEILSRTASPNVAAAATGTSSAAGHGHGDGKGAAQPAIVDLTMSPSQPTSTEAGGSGVDTGAPVDSEDVELIDLDAEKTNDDDDESAEAGHQAAVLKRQWSTDFPPDMAPVEGELQHRWLKLRRLVEERRG